MLITAHESVRAHSAGKCSGVLVPSKSVLSWCFNTAATNGGRPGGLGSLQMEIKGNTRTCRGPSTKNDPGTFPLESTRGFGCVV